MESWMNFLLKTIISSPADEKGARPTSISWKIENSAYLQGTQTFAVYELENVI